MTEAEETRILANRILDRHSADPDADEAMLARQLLRADEKLARANELLTAANHALLSYKYGNLPPDLAEEMADMIAEYLGGNVKGLKPPRTGRSS